MYVFTDTKLILASRTPIMPFVGVTQKPVGMVAVMAERVCQPG